MKRIPATLMLAAMAALAACGGGDEGRAGLSADQERELDNVAGMLDEADVVDASPDSLTLNETDFEEEGTQAPAAADANEGKNAQR